MLRARFLGWINNEGGNPQELNNKVWDLANSITDTIDSYILYRPNLIKIGMATRGAKNIK